MTTVVTTADYTLAVSQVRSRARDWLPWLYLVVALPAIVLFSVIMAPVQWRTSSTTPCAPTRSAAAQC
jgi:hypothetical protein